MQPPSPLAQNATIGIVGGGQLGRMLAIAAARLDFRTVILEPQADCPAAQTANRQIVAPYADKAALEALIDACDVVTYEFENVDASAMAIIEEKRPLFPPVDALRISQDRLTEKQFMQSAGLEVAPYRDIAGADDLAAALEEFGSNGILKTRRFGYDGKGQMRLSGAQDRTQLERTVQDLEGAPAILEGLVDFDCEISVIGARGQNGAMSCFDPARNEHRDGILARSTVPSGVATSVIDTAKERTCMLMEKLGYVGVLGLEFFVGKDASLIANEFAPRVHNSGHWTEAACTVSQFEQHIRAIAGWPLDGADRHSDCVMDNLLGDDIFNLAELASKPGAFVHSYGKSEARPGRKMGHVTYISERDRG